MHVPVLLHEVIKYLDVRSNKNYVDATLGGGGYTREILKRNGPDGKIAAIDWNKEAIKKFKDVSERLTLVQGNFRDIAELVPLKNIAGVVFDLGLSSDLLERSGRGFSFKRDEPLLMNYELGIKNQGTARDVLNLWTKQELERIFKEYGEIRQARRIAEGIVNARRKSRIETTGDLRKVVGESVKSATPKLLAQVWQAIRIAVNDELKNLKKGLEGAWEILEPEGRIAVVSYHSLEDRIVKNFFRERTGDILTKKPVRPSIVEVKRNPRSRSAKLRAVEKL